VSISRFIRRVRGGRKITAGDSENTTFKRLHDPRLNRDLSISRKSVNVHARFTP